MTFSPISKKKSLVKETLALTLTLTLNSIGQKEVDKVLLYKLPSDKKFVHARQQCKSTQNAPILDSTFGQYLLDYKICAEKFIINWFLVSAT